MNCGDIKNIKKESGTMTINELIDILYGESVHICTDEIEASSLAVSALSDFLKSYPFLVYPVRSYSVKK